MYCFECGEKVERGQSFCVYCGTDLRGEAGYREDHPTKGQQAASIQGQMKDTFLHATERINHLVGEEGTIDVNLREVFSSVFQKHTKEEGELLFISAKSNNDVGRETATTWPRPWLFSRIFLILASTYFLLYICTILFQNLNALPGMIIIGSFTVPFSLLIFFWEMNAPRNISIYEVAKMLFLGGAGSLVTTMILYSIFPIYDFSFSGAIIIGILEEVGKLAIIGYFIKKLNSTYILNGLLIGATIGAGFSAFESAGYAFNYGLIDGESAMISVIFMRAWMSIGTHIVWSAIAGAALVYVKGSAPLVSNNYSNTKFLKLFSVPIILHAVWDMPLYALHHFYLLFIILIVIAWVFIFSFINAGLKQIVRLNQL